MEAAALVLADYGLRRSTIGQIAELAGVSKGLVLYHFDSKDELFVRVIEVEEERLDHELAAIAETSEPASEKLRQAVRANVQFMTKGKYFWLSVWYEGRFLTQDISQLMSQHHRVQTETISKIIDEGKASGEFGTISTYKAGVVARGLILHAGFSIYLRPESERNNTDCINQVADRTAKVLMELLRPVVRESVTR